MGQEGQQKKTGVRAAQGGMSWVGQKVIMSQKVVQRAVGSVRDQCGLGD